MMEDEVEIAFKANKVIDRILIYNQKNKYA